jgi:hypothetical protein
MKTPHLVLSLVTFMLVACGDGDGPSGVSATSLDPKDAVAYQLELLKAGDVEKLKDCFTDRQKGRITSDLVEQAKAGVGAMTIEDLFASVEMGEHEGKKTAKVKMKNGRTLTTLIQTDGKWLADTVWMK